LNKTLPIGATIVVYFD